MAKYRRDSKIFATNCNAHGLVSMVTGHHAAPKMLTASLTLSAHAQRVTVVVESVCLSVCL